jgi:hypothetical protein
MVQLGDADPLTSLPACWSSSLKEPNETEDQTARGQLPRGDKAGGRHQLDNAVLNIIFQPAMGVYEVPERAVPVPRTEKVEELEASTRPQYPADLA